MRIAMVAATVCFATTLAGPGLAHAQDQTPVRRVPTTQVAVSAAVTPPIVAQGSSATIVGDAPKAATASWIVLQHFSHGVWSNLRQRRLTGTKHVEFAVKPSSGVHRYRLMLPPENRQARAVSEPVTLTVKWQPSLTFAASWTSDPTGKRVVRAEGVTTYLGSGEVQLKGRSPDGAWVALGSAALASGTFRTTMDYVTGGLSLAPGTPLVAVLPGTTLRSRQEASAVVPALDPMVLTLNDPAGLRQPELAPYAGAFLDLTAGDVVTLYHVGGSTPAVIAPSFEPVTPQSSDAHSITFKAIQTGRYRIAADPDVTQLYASTPKVAAVALGADYAVPPTVIGQVVYVRFHAAADTLITLGHVGAGSALSGPDGTLVPQWYDGPSAAFTSYRLPVAGDYRLRYPHGATASGRVDEVPTIDIESDQSPAALAVAAGQALGRVRIQNPGRVPFSLRAPFYEGIADVADYVLVDAQGNELSDQWEVTQPGADVYYLLVNAPGETTYWAAESPVALAPSVDGPITPIALAAGDCAWFRGQFDATTGVVDLGGISAQQHFALTGPGAESPWSIGAGDGWMLPTTGTYGFEFTRCGEWNADLALTSWPQLSLPADGTPLFFGTAGADRRAIFLPGAAGVTYQLLAAPVPGSDWSARVLSGGASHEQLASADTANPDFAAFTLPDANGAWVLWQSTTADPADVTLSATPLP